MKISEILQALKPKMLVILLTSCFIPTAFCQFGNEDLHNGLVAYYNLDNNSLDGTSNGNDGVGASVSATSDRHGASNLAYSFNGTSSAITVSPSASLNTASMTDMTITLWVNATNTTLSPANRNILQFINGSNSYDLFWVFSPGSEAIWFSNWNGGSVYNMSSGTLSPGTWYFVTLVIGANSELYIDNSLVASSSTAPVQPSSPYFEIGRHRTNGWNFDGTIDDMHIYDRALSTNEMTQLYNEGIGTGLMAFYPFNNNPTDNSGFMNKATSGTIASYASDRNSNGSEAATFNGTSNFIATDPDASITPSFMAGTTVVAWVKPTGSPTPSNPDNRNIFQLIDGTNGNTCHIYEVFYNYSTEKFLLANWNAGSSNIFTYTTGTYPIGSWYQIAAVFDHTGGNCELYVTDVSSSTTTPTIAHSSVTLYPPGAGSWLVIGKHAIHSGWNFKGDIDGFRVYNQALTGTDIANLWGLSLHKNGPLAVENAKGDIRGMEVYPNPVRDRLFFNLGNENEGNVTVNVYNTIGAKISATILNSADVESGIDVSLLPAGVYYVETEDSKGVRFTRRMVKE